MKAKLSEMGRTRRGSNLFFAKDGNGKNGTMERGNQHSFWKPPFDDVLRTVAHDLALNDLFVCLIARELSQNTGFPTRGPTSAQLASLPLIFWEVSKQMLGELEHMLWNTCTTHHTPYTIHHT